MRNNDVNIMVILKRISERDEIELENCQMSEKVFSARKNLLSEIKDIIRESNSWE